MSLRTKLVLILTCVIAAYGVFHLAIQRAVVVPSFLELEQRQAQKDLRRVVEAIHNEVDHLDTTCHDWSAWDDTYEFVQDGNAKYIEGNLQNSSIESANVDMMYFARLDGTVVRKVVREPGEGEPPLELAEFDPGTQPADHPLRSVGDDGTAVTGILMTAQGPMLVSSRPIVKSNREGPTVGCLVMGRMLDAQGVASLVEQTRVGFELWQLDRAQDLPAEVRAGWESVREGGGEAIQLRDEHSLAAFAPILDMQGRPVVLVEADIPRDVMSEGARAVEFALGSAVGAGVLILCVLTLLLQRTVVDPLLLLSGHAVRIGRTGDLDSRLSSTRRDEIGVLSRELDAMCDELTRYRQEQVQSARRAGMSEVAEEVLHDVGNVLNSVNVSAGAIDEGLRRLRTDDLARISEAIESRAGDLGTFLATEEKGLQIRSYLRLLAGRLEAERAALARESRGLSEGLEHIHELVRAQQDRAGAAEAAESVSLGAEIETAVRISGADAGGRVAIEREVAPGARVLVRKHRMLQILVNLLKNARESLDEAGVAEPRIAIRAGPTQDGGGLRIEIQDNGLGIERERLVSVFAHGHTTKTAGRGVGLHASANAAREMGGSLAVRSEGRGRGATFVLDLPLEREAAAA